MDRRTFLKIGGAFFVLSSSCDFKEKLDQKKVLSYGITLDSNRKIGHLARKSILKPVSKQMETDVLIVGGGIAGLAAACSLKNRNFTLCEMNKNLGGTSGAVNINGTLFGQGAHYDLSYPEYYGKEALDLLQKLNVIEWSKVNRRWDFVDKEYLIKPNQEEQCYSSGSFLPSVLPPSELKKNMLDLLRPYIGKTKLPTTLVSPELHHLDKVSFYNYLNKYLPITDEFIASIDYQMLDDYGGTSNEVSALAGIHYYTSRPYYGLPEPELFSPPEGNYYFIRKMEKSIPAKSIKTGHLITGVEKEDSHWVTHAWNIKEEKKIEIKSNNIIYAGQKHLLKYLYPEAFEQFESTNYAPWIVVNIELKEAMSGHHFWQNDYLSVNSQFLGFVDSGAQKTADNNVLTAYYCYPGIYHHMVEEIENNPRKIVEETIEYLTNYYQTELASKVKHAYVKLLGHAMPVPTPGFLTKTKPTEKSTLTFAGVDTGRLPLMLDALDSGIQAAEQSI